MKNVDTIIVGGGISGLSLSSFLDKPAVVLERENTFGGLSRSYSLNGIAYDIGPHIIFSKNKEVLDLHTSVIETNQLRRSNQIFYKNRYVKYPFENDLYALDEDERDYCLKEFLKNPYEQYTSNNMLQFFLKTFGEGITRTYLQPYNEKIWKFDPAYMDTQMVDRIPKPPKEDVIKSANGTPTEGYTHQLYFHYPKQGGFQTLVDTYANSARSKGHGLICDVTINSIQYLDEHWEVLTSQGKFRAKNLVNTAPIHEFCKYLELPSDVKTSLDNMLFNSIYIVMIQVKKDAIGDHFALYIPEKDIIFHRLSKLNFLGEEYCLPDDGSTLMAEVTFRPDSYLSTLTQGEVRTRVIDDLCKLGLIERPDVIATEIRYEKYAYVIYDLDHRKNTDSVLTFLRKQHVFSAGRFAEFEYLNSDAVVERTLKLAKEINSL